MRLAAAAVICVALFCHSAAARELRQASNDTTGLVLAGYTFGSDVAGYVAMSKDVCDLLMAVDEASLTLAQDIYANGKNSFRSNGELRTLQAWASGSHEGEPTWDLYSAYFGNDTAWVDTFLTAAFAGEDEFGDAKAQAQAIKKGVQANLQMAYMMHELDAAADRIANNETDVTEGAPHNVDEAAGIYFGNGCTTGNLANIGDKRATTFGTLVQGADGKCTGATNVMASEALVAMHTAAKEGDLAAYTEAYNKMVKALVVTYAQATLTYGRNVGDAVANNEATAEDAAEGMTFFRTIAPIVAAADAGAAADIMAAFTSPSADSYDKVSAAFQKVAGDLGVTETDLGTLDAESNCVDSAAPAPTAEAPTASVASLTSGAASLTAPTSVLLAAAVAAVALLA